MTEGLYAKVVYIGTGALFHWGERAQAVKACEEMAELTVKLCKRMNRSPTTDEEIVDEIADVLIMAFQMRNIFGIEEVDDRIAIKLDRLKAALDRFKDVPPSGESMQVERPKQKEVRQ